MKEEIDSITFHDDLFHAGKNFSKKVDVSKFSGLSISLNNDTHRFEVSYQNRTRYLPELSAFSWELVTQVPIPKIENEHRTEDKSKRSRAQASTPQGHVFAGPGAGVVRDK